MDSELNRSVRLLEDAISIQGGSLFKKGVFKTKKTETPYKSNLSILPLPEESQYLTKRSSYINLTSTVDSTLAKYVDKNRTMTGSIIKANEPWINTLDSLYIEFLEVLQSHTSTQAILDVVSDLAHCCSDALSVIKTLKSKVSVDQTNDEEVWLEQEQNIWRLIFILFQDRLNIQSLQSEDEQYNQYVGLSEKMCMLNLFKRDHLVRETQLVIDWLENNAAEKYDEVLRFADGSAGWENTLHQLQSEDTIVFGSSREIVSSLEPDAPHYQNKPLHDLDIQDEKRLCHYIFTGIRCGKLNDVQKLCMHCGHSWRAALFEGWKLHHDPNMELEDEMSDKIEAGGEIHVRQMEGNENRDLWKLMALKYCEQVQLSQYERASIAAYCGYLRELLPVCHDWSDYLWAYLKVMIDIRVESELRDCVNKKYRDLPDFYWKQKMSLNEIFTILDSSKNKLVYEGAQKKEHVIQKHIILDETKELLEQLDHYVNDAKASTQFLRFAAHLVLFYDQIGRIQKKDVLERILEAYVNRLMNMDDIQLVAFYVSKMSSSKQIELYSYYLERIVDDDNRRESLRCAENCGMNVHLITKTVVENIRRKPFEIGDVTLQQKLTVSDEYKISSIDWLLFYDSQRPEALIQSNALISKFLTASKHDAASLLFNKIPSDSVDKILSEGEVSDEIKQAIREHLSYKSYLDAQEAFNVWFKHFKSKPIPPEPIPENAHLTEKVAHQHRTSQFKAETERWKLTISHLAKSAKTLLYNVLLFPDGGWLSGAAEAEYLRAHCIPECVLLLASVLFESKLYSECVQLADILASEKYCLYKVYDQQKLQEILNKLTECSVALLEEKKDPWGNDTAL